jgi:hypothetical protein
MKGGILMKKDVSYNDDKYLNDWLRLGIMLKMKLVLTCNSNDFQNQNGIFY